MPVLPRIPGHEVGFRVATLYELKLRAETPNRLPAFRSSEMSSRSVTVKSSSCPSASGSRANSEWVSLLR
jgi:hypothetical protein